MKLQYKPVEKDSLSSIYVKRTHQPYLSSNWHFHKEIELIYFLKGQGMRIVGDHISNFKEGELVLVGEWLPHLWRNETQSISGRTAVDFIVLKFPKDLNGVCLFSLPELTRIRELMKDATRGILFPKNILPKIHRKILQLCNSTSTEKLICFLQVMKILSEEEDYQLLSSPDFTPSNQIIGENRLHKIINYISDNYARVITLEEIASEAFMTPPAFCRFFKTRTNKTFSHFLNEVRVNKACQLLINDEKPIKQICYEVGFSSLTNFNRTFRNFKSLTPSSYRSNYRIFRK